MARWHVVGAKSTEHGVYDRIDPLVFPLQYKESKFAVLVHFLSFKADSFKLFSNPEYHKVFKANSAKILQIPTPLPYDPLIEVNEAQVDNLFAQLPQTLRRVSSFSCII